MAAYGFLGSEAAKNECTEIAEGAKQSPPGSFPLIDNEETLLDQTDLVFVDPVGTGLSEAIAPHRNSDFWGMEVDPKLLRISSRDISI